MTAAELLADLTCRGFDLAREGTGIRIAPASRLTPELRAAVLERKAELLALGSCPACARLLDAGRRCWGCNYRACEGCGRDTGSPFIALCLACEAEERRR
jgi:hypothetical protein